MTRRIHLDQAATSYPKAPGVGEAMAACVRDVAGTPGRGSHAGGREAAEAVWKARREVAALLGAEAPERIAFTAGATDGLHLVIDGLVRAAELEGQAARFVTSRAEHDAVARPLSAWKLRGTQVVPVDVDPVTALPAASTVCHALGEGTTAVVVGLVSNVTGAIQWTAGLARACREAGVLLVLDAAQAAGHLPLNLADLGADIVVCSGHKGLLGPAGVGVLYVRAGVEAKIAPVRLGGTGGADREGMPAKFEAGTPNVPGIAGLGASAGWLRATSVDAVRAHELGLTSRMLAGLQERGVRHPLWKGTGSLGSLRLLGPVDPHQRTGIVSLVHDDLGAEELAGMLEASFGIACRGGVACAPGTHAALGSGGAVRLSVGAFTTEGDVDDALRALDEIA